MSKPDANVDPSEISKFEETTSRWWDRNGAFKALHDINSLRLNYIRERSVLGGRQVLDVGCGGGILSEAMAASGAEVTGIDMGHATLSAAKSHVADSGLSIAYMQITVEDLAKTHPEKFDAVTCLEMLEHVPDPSSVVRACKTLVRPGGDVFFATINRNPKAFLFAIVGAEYFLRLVPKGTHAYRKFIKPSELNACAQAAGLTLMNLTGMHYNPFTGKYSLGGNTNVNYLMHLRRP